MVRTRLVVALVVPVAAVFATGRLAEPGGGPARPAAPAPTGTGWISGTVTDEEGAPLAGVEVKVGREGSKETWSAKTDAKGKYGVRGVPPGPATVFIRLRGRMTITKNVTVPSSGVVGADAKLALGVRFAGVVRNLKDEPVAGARLVAFQQREDSGFGFMFTSASLGGGGESKADGTYEVDGLGPGDRYTLRVVHPKFRPVDLPGLSGEAGGGHDRLDVLLEDAAWVTGTVVDRQGKPVPGVRVVAPNDPFAIQNSFMGFFFLSMSLGSDERNVSDAQGRFLVGSLEPVEARLSAEGPNHFPGSVLVSPTAGQETKGVVITLELATATVEGTVVDDLGKAVPKATLYAWTEDERAAEGVADDLGRFRLTRVKAKKPVHLRAEAGGHEGGTTENVPLESKGAKVTLKRMGRLVLDVKGPDGARIPEVRVRLLTGPDANRRGGRTTYDQRKGPIEVLLPLGGVEIHVSAPGFEEAKVGSYDPEPGERVDGGTITLEKADAAAKPGSGSDDDSDDE
jgi:protocatechuate 3,4-dioxygenase beta subunit